MDTDEHNTEFLTTKYEWHRSANLLRPVRTQVVSLFKTSKLEAEAALHLSRLEAVRGK